MAIKRGERDTLLLGDLSAEIDWGYAPDFVKAMYLIMQLNEPDDFIIATGKTHSVREFVTTAFSRLNLIWTDHVQENKLILNGTRSKLYGDPAKLKKITGWEPSVSFEKIIDNMLNNVL